MEVLENPERNWEQTGEAAAIDREEIRARIGDVDGSYELLDGGLANANVRVDDDRLLRVYRRDVGALDKEAALLEREWRAFRVPEVLDRGDDFLVLEYVDHGPIGDAPEYAEAVGRALAEVHRIGFAEPGFLGPEAGRVVEPFGDFFGAFRGHVASREGVPAEIRRRVVDQLDAHRDGVEALAERAVLLHGDFKVSNLHWSDDDRLLVLDWEFAYAGPALADVGQLLRWTPSSAFRRRFAASYRQAGGELPEEWERWAALLDLVNLVGLIDGADEGSRRMSDVRRRIGAFERRWVRG